MVTFDRHGDVFVLDLGGADNRFDASSVRVIHACLDAVDAAAGPVALATVATGKIWSNGLDLAYMSELDQLDVAEFLADVERTFARLLRLQAPTVAAIQGHVFAAGAMFALAHDVRVMRDDRGFFCLPEVDLRLPFSPGMAALIAAKLPQPALHRTAVLGERVGGRSAHALGIVDAVADSEHAVRTLALERAAASAPKASSTLSALRQSFYGAAIAALASAPTIESAEVASC